MDGGEAEREVIIWPVPDGKGMREREIEGGRREWRMTRWRGAEKCSGTYPMRRVVVSGEDMMEDVSPIGVVVVKLESSELLPESWRMMQLRMSSGARCQGEGIRELWGE